MHCTVWEREMVRQARVYVDLTISIVHAKCYGDRTMSRTEQFQFSIQGQKCCRGDILQRSWFGPKQFSIIAQRHIENIIMLERYCNIYFSSCLIYSNGNSANLPQTRKMRIACHTRGVKLSPSVNVISSFSYTFIQSLIHLFHFLSRQ